MFLRRWSEFFIFSTLSWLYLGCWIVFQALKTREVTESRSFIVFWERHRSWKSRNFGCQVRNFRGTERKKYSLFLRISYMVMVCQNCTVKTRSLTNMNVILFWKTHLILKLFWYTIFRYALKVDWKFIWELQNRIF